jgi:hypothetical protein
VSASGSPMATIAQRVHATNAGDSKLRGVNHTNVSLSYSNPTLE